jgi:predicted Zn-dependent protease
LTILSTSRFRNGLIAAITLLLMLPGCDDAFQSAANYASVAEAQLAAGNIDEARESIRRAISARDDVASYYILLGRIELQAERPASAFNAYSLALDLQADNPEVLQSIAELGLQTGRIKEAGEAADRILLLSPGSSRALLVKGFIAIDNGQLDEADRMATEILARNSNDEGGIILSARIDALRGDVGKALTAIQKGISALGATNALNVTLLEIYRIQGDAKGMRRVFPEVLKTMDEDIEYQLDYVNLLYKMGDAAAARAIALKAIEADPNDAQLLAALGDLWLEYDRKPLAASQWAYVAESGTRSSQIALARFYHKIGDDEVAQSLLKRASDSGVSEAQGVLARVMLARRDIRRADALANALLKADPRNEDALLVRAQRHLANGQLDRAIEDANIVVADSPQEYLGYVVLAGAYSANGSAIRARQTFERGMDALPQSKLLADAYREFLVDSGDTNRVVSLYQDLAIAKPSSVVAWTAFARACAEFGDGICARKVESGLARAKTSFVIDEPPGTPPRRGLFARITPEEICATTGGVCTGS